jgi:hypothetical protein
MTEYTLVFRRAVGRRTRVRSSGHPWVVVRPAGVGQAPDEEAPNAPGDMAQVFFVPICSALEMDGSAYERFLTESGVLDAALAVLGTGGLKRRAAVVTARKEVQALVMAAEVQHIIERMSA